MTRLLFAIYLIEAGTLLVIAPWTQYWERNWFGELAPVLSVLMASPYLKGAVSGVGVLTGLVGLRDLVVLLFVRAPRPAPGGSEPPAP